MIRQFKHIHSIVVCVSILLATFFLNGCSTQPPAKKSPIKTVSEPISKDSLDQTAEEKLDLAKTLNRLEPTPLLTVQINELLVESSELFLQQQDFTKALWLANKSTEMIKGNFALSYRLLLVKVQSLQSLGQHVSAYEQLQLARQLVEYANKNSDVPSLTLTLNYYLSLQKSLEVKQQPVKALAAQLTAFYLNIDSSPQDITSLWNKLVSLDQWQVTQLIKDNPPLIKGWQQLLSYSHKFGGGQEQFSYYLNLWKKRYPTHPAMVIVEQLQTTKLSVNTIENVAVLLPLSGAQAGAGLAAQQGILAAYNNDSTINVHFIDTTTVDWTTLATRFSDSSIDHVIGPLLKSNLDTYLRLSEEQEALQIPSLFLNLPNNGQFASYQTALSMRPEDEAVQAASTLSQKQYKNPIILCHQDSVSKRIAVAFSRQWETLTAKKVDIVYFNQGKQMQASLKEALDVNSSQLRIKHLQSKLKNNIKAEPRNRRDIDMIYLIGSAAQTRLIKPYIDVNTSPFATIIPVFASSRSHSQFDYNHNISGSTNDLQGLTFTQMPWLLTSKQQNKNLSLLSHQLWPKRTDSLSRLFAMGFDSYNLLSKSFLMQQAAYIQHYGQTGVLRLNSNNVLTRSLIWGKYQNKKVLQIAMD